MIRTLIVLVMGAAFSISALAVPSQLSPKPQGTIVKPAVPSQL